LFLLVEGELRYAVLQQEAGAVEGQRLGGGFQLQLGSAAGGVPLLVVVSGPMISRLPPSLA